MNGLLRRLQPGADQSGRQGTRLHEDPQSDLGSTPEAAIHRSGIQLDHHAGTHKTSSIKVAEAAKVIENTQRDVNIALINELAMIFERVGIDTEEVLEAAGTKWNFLPFRPGLVGGHCIGVDPYYLTYKAQQLGYHPQMILAGRGINDNMPMYVASRIIKNMICREHPADGCEGADPGADVQGELPGSAQHQGDRYRARADVLRRPRRGARSVGRRGRGRSEYGLDLVGSRRRGV